MEPLRTVYDPKAVETRLYEGWPWSVAGAK